ncbi:MAG: M48 family metallopeptidase [Ruminococcaceae bacterium]|jgi:hypothetical protein|nr:M48 family metallopeptidase [Oscillospiraceae bacterium]
MKRLSDALPLPFSLGGDAQKTVPVVRSDRKTVSLELKRDGTFFLRAPRRCDDAFLLSFLKSREGWLRSHLKKQEDLRRANESMPAEKLGAEQIRALAEDALLDLPERVRRYAPLVGVTYGRITVRNQKTRWGSCSSAGNLNFNCLLMLTPPEVRDYVVIHELCHRLEMNHSPRFWAEVARVCPDYKLRLRWLKEHGGAIMARMTGE